MCDIQDKIMSESLKYHRDHGMGVDMNVFRPGSDSFFNLFKEARDLYEIGLYDLNEEEKYYILETDLGEWGYYMDDYVPLDYPILEGTEDEISLMFESNRRRKQQNKKTTKSRNTYKGRKVKLNKPKRGGKSGKFYVYVRNPKTDRIIKVEFGAKGMTTGLNDPKRVKSFIARHRCKTHANDKTKAAYWSCRLPRYFGNSGKKWW